MTVDVYRPNWSNTSTQSLGGTTRTGNIARESSFQFPADAPFFIGSLHTQRTADSDVISTVTASSQDQTYITYFSDVNSIKANVNENGLVTNFADRNAFTCGTLGSYYAVFDAANADPDNRLLYVDVNGVFSARASDPGAGFTLYTRGGLVRVSEEDQNSIESITSSITHNGVTYANGITYRLITKN